MSRRSFGRRLEDFFLLEVVPPLGALLISLLYRTLRVKHLDYHKIKEIYEKKQSSIWAFWHGQLLMMPFILHPFPLWTRVILISQHRDGELITRLMAKLGYASVRGSKTRGGFGALRKILRLLREGKIFVITPDGPRGPRYQVKPNVIQIAKATGAPIFPMVFRAKPCKTFASWDAFIIPYPFSRAAYIWGDPLWISATATEEEMETARKALENYLSDLSAKAQKIAEGNFN